MLGAAFAAEVTNRKLVIHVFLQPLGTVRVHWVAVSIRVERSSGTSSMSLDSFSLQLKNDPFVALTVQSSSRRTACVGTRPIIICGFNASKPN